MQFLTIPSNPIERQFSVMSLIEHAERELKLAGLTEPDSDYYPMLYNNIMDIVKVFSEAGHSGMSASITVNILNRLLSFKSLTPLTADPDEWNEVGSNMWQSNRQADAFSDNAGLTWYFLDRKPESGEHIYHHPSGEYLGVVSEVTNALVKFVGPRTINGGAGIAGFDEVRLGPDPVSV